MQVKRSSSWNRSGGQRWKLWSRRVWWLRCMMCAMKTMLMSWHEKHRTEHPGYSMSRCRACGRICIERSWLITTIRTWCDTIEMLLTRLCWQCWLCWQCKDNSGWPRIFSYALVLLRSVNLLCIYLLCMYCFFKTKAELYRFGLDIRRDENWMRNQRLKQSRRGTEDWFSRVISDVRFGPPTWCDPQAKMTSLTKIAGLVIIRSWCIRSSDFTSHGAVHLLLEFICSFDMETDGSPGGRTDWEGGPYVAGRGSAWAAICHCGGAWERERDFIYIYTDTCIIYNYKIIYIYIYYIHT